MHKKMFDGMPEQFYHFLATTTSRTTPTNNNNNNNNDHFPAFDASYHHNLLTNNNDHHHHPHHIKSVESSSFIINPSSSSSSSSLVMFHEIPWSNDEMLALFRIRSSLDDNTWFPDFIWENVSRKLAELGFKRSAEKCKEKFEEETRSFNCSIITDNCSNKNNNNNNNNSNNYRLFSELEVLCNNNNNNNNNNTINNNNNNVNNNNIGILHHHYHHHHHTIDVDQDHPLLQTNEENKDEDKDEDEEDGDLDVDEDEKRGGEILEDEDEDEEIEGEEEEEEEEENTGGDDGEQSIGDSEKTEEKNTKRDMRKRKRQKKFEMFKGFCEKIVNKMMAQQQQLHCKILQDMVKRDEEKIAKEEAWKRQEFERLEKELEFRANEKAISGDRQDKILDFLNKFNSSSSSSTTTYHALDNQSLKQTLEKLIITKVPNIITTCSNNYSSILSQDSIISALHVQPTSSSCTTTTTTHDHDHDHDHAQAHTPLVMTQQTCPNIEPNSSSNENNLLGVMSSPSRLLVNSKLAPPMISSSSMDQTASQNPNPDPLISHKVLPCEFSKFDDHTSTNATDHITDDFKTLEDQGGLTRMDGNCKDDTGRRWPRDEVLALINIRCSLFNNNNNGSGGNIHNNDRENFSKGPLWERISQKMMELGYKRSAKRCKEKWENINKYFRKTKDLNKKRSIDSRTCPYFHQLIHLYSQGQGAPVGPTDRPVMNQPGSPENRSMPFIEAQLGGSSAFANENANDATIINTIMHANEGVVQVPGFDFEF